MRLQHRKNVLALFYIIFIFVIGMIFLVAIIDFLIAPFLIEFIQEPNRREWCGLIYQCASQAQITFAEYIGTMMLWKNFDVIYILHRLKTAVILGFFIGICYIAILILQRKL